MKYKPTSSSVIITGSSGLLGKELVKAYLDQGLYVIGIDTVKNKHNNSKFFFLKCDIANELDIKKIFSFLKKNKLKPQILVNNAANSFFGPFNKRKVTEIDKMTSVNIKGTFLLIREFYKNIKKSKENLNIVNIASIYGLISPDPKNYQFEKMQNSEIYGATKAGVIQMTKYFAIHLKDKNIRVNSISPGGIFNTENPQSKFFIDKYSSKNPLGRMAKVSEIVDGVIFLSSDKASYVNGHNLVIDGGMSCW